MKLLAFLAAIAFFHGSLARSHIENYLPQKEAVDMQQFIFEGVVNNTINNVIDVIAQFDPVVVDQKQVNVMGHAAEVQNLRVEGFANTVATRIKLSGLFTYTLQLVLENPRVAALVEYWTAEGGTLYGDGSASAELKDLKFTVKAKINPLGMSVKELKVTPTVGSVAVKITGLYNDEELSQQVSDQLTNLITTIINSPAFHQKLSEILLSIIKVVLG